MNVSPEWLHLLVVSIVGLAIRRVEKYLDRVQTIESKMATLEQKVDDLWQSRSHSHSAGC